MATRMTSLTLAAAAAGGLAIAAWRGAAAAEAVTTDATPAVPDRVVFDGFGLDQFAGAGSIAAALAGIGAAPPVDEQPLGVPVDVRVRGPSGRGNPADPLAAEFRSRIEWLDLAAGMQADPAGLGHTPARWSGAVGVASDHDRGRDLLELRTLLARSPQVGILGVEVGPRIERRLRGGSVFFLDGKAQAQARRAGQDGGWMMPGLAERGTDGSGMVGITAATGLIR